MIKIINTCIEKKMEKNVQTNMLGQVLKLPFFFFFFLGGWREGGWVTFAVTLM